MSISLCKELQMRAKNEELLEGETKPSGADRYKTESQECFLRVQG